MSKTLVVAMTQDELAKAAKDAGITVVPSMHNKRRVTLLDKGERMDAYSDDADTTIYYFPTGKRQNLEDFQPMPIIVEKLLGVLGLLEEKA